MGQITIELYWDHAPETCRNFAELCRRGYYNNTKFHRIIRNFMIQGNIFNAYFNWSIIFFLALIQFIIVI